jgi:hypothetical protein
VRGAVWIDRTMERWFSVHVSRAKCSKMTIDLRGTKNGSQTREESNFSVRWHLVTVSSIALEALCWHVGKVRSTRVKHGGRTHKVQSDRRTRREHRKKKQKNSELTAQRRRIIFASKMRSVVQQQIAAQMQIAKVKGS